MTSIPDQRMFWNEWHRKHGATGEDVLRRQSRRMFLDAIEPSDSQRRVLDLGCGRGHDLRAFARAGHQVCGLDFSPEAIRFARMALRRRRWPQRRRPRLYEHDIAEPLPFGGETFDGVFSHLALHYFPDDVTRRIFGEIGRVAKPRGVLAFTVKSVEDSYYGQGERLSENLYCRKGHLRHFFSDKYVTDLLAGWQITDLQHGEGRYASHEPSHFITAVARKP